MTYLILLISVLNCFSHSRSPRRAGFRMGVKIGNPTYVAFVADEIKRFGSVENSRFAHRGRVVAASVDGIGDPHTPTFEVQTTCRLSPVVLCLPEYSSGDACHDQHGTRVPSIMYCWSGLSSSAVGTYVRRSSPRAGTRDRMTLLIVACDVPKSSASSCWT